MNPFNRIVKRFNVAAGYYGNRMAAKNPVRYLQDARADLKADAQPPRQVSWEFRLGELLACPDTQKLEYVSDAGQCLPGCQVMHNGIKVPLGSYYGRITAAVFADTRGVHEPQEELAFGQFLKNLSAEGGSPVMMELGAYWAFYSAWFKRTMPNGRTILVEPMWENMQFGLGTYALNGLTCDSMRALIGDSYVPDPKLPVVSVPWLMNHYQLDTLDLLHSDIQGYERDMLRGAEELLNAKRIRVLFVSTHSADVHSDCVKMMSEAGYHIGLSLMQKDSYAYDGMIIAARPGDEHLIANIEVSRRSDVHPEDSRGWWS